MKTVLFALGFGIGTHAFMDFHISHDRFKMNMNGKCVVNVANPKHTQKNYGTNGYSFWKGSKERRSNLRTNGFFPNYHFLGFWNSPKNIHTKIEDISKHSVEQFTTTRDISLTTSFESTKTLSSLDDLQHNLAQQENFFDPETFKFFDAEHFQQKLKKELQSTFNWGKIVKQQEKKSNHNQQIAQQFANQKENIQNDIKKLVDNWKTHIQDGLGKKLVATEIAMNSDAIEGKFEIKEQ